MPGFVDEVTPQFVRGWYVADNREPAERGVIISVNGDVRYCALCQEARPDVVEAGITTRLDVGFRAPLALQIGDLVRVRALDSGRLLGGGLAVVMPETGPKSAPDGWLSAMSYGDLPAFRPFLQPLAASLDVQAFRPLFGHRGNLSAVGVRTPKTCYVIHRARPRHHVAWLERLHRCVLEPHAVGAPLLEAVIRRGESASLMVEHIEGQPLGPFVASPVATSSDGVDDPGNRADVASTTGNEQAYRDTIASVIALSRVRWPDEMRRSRSNSDDMTSADTTSPGSVGAGRKADRRGRHALRRMVRDVCLSALNQGHWRELALLLRMARILYRLPRVVSHGDLHPQNVLIETHTGRPVFIDWDHAGMLPPGLDLARLLLSVPPALAERWIGDDRERRLGWLIMTYVAQSQRQPDFHATEAGVYLRRRFRELSKDRYKQVRLLPIRSVFLPLIALYAYDNGIEPALILTGLSG
ncbi:hypothetical protein BTW08_03610 [Salinicola sp. MH3R3-1]|uniref:phosphotransferase n=1 Tax=Salinicola sp. MH3R3-1 TaxID=1928762 RepID=UPI00094F0373|nr:phosphotransferase [Salinicola sp. MH3R3-1]OLO08945.1 hypothetical protein BTW08_03610 [Salinicola sp. MH3R3-1]